MFSMTNANAAADALATLTAEIADHTKWIKLYAERGWTGPMMLRREKRERAWQQLAQLKLAA